MNKKQITAVVIFVAFFAVYFGIEMYASKVAEGRVNEAIARGADVADVDYKKVRVRLLGMNVLISDVVFSPVDTGEKITIDEIIIREFDDSTDMPAFMSMSLNGIELNFDEIGEDAHRLRDLGYTDKMLMNLDLDYSYDQENKELNVKNMGIGADDAGVLSFGFRLGNIDLSPEKIAFLFFTYPQVMMHEAKIIYEDDSLTDRLISAAAREEGVSEEEFRKEMNSEVDALIEDEKDDFTRSGLAELKDFLNNPGKLSISASPSTPHPLGRIMRVSDPKELISLLQIEIKS